MLFSSLKVLRSHGRQFIPRLDEARLPDTFSDAASWIIFGLVFLASLRRVDPILLIVLSGVAGYLIYG